MCLTKLFKCVYQRCIRHIDGIVIRNLILSNEWEIESCKIWFTLHEVELLSSTITPTKSTSDENNASNVTDAPFYTSDRQMLSTNPSWHDLQMTALHKIGDIINAFQFRLHIQPLR